MVVEIEGVQKIIRRIRAGHRLASYIVSEQASVDPGEMRILLEDIADDVYRVISLILAETGHWQPRTFVDALKIAAVEDVIQADHIDEISKIPDYFESITKAESFDGYTAEILQMFFYAVSLLCQNISDYLVHTELPI